MTPYVILYVIISILFGFWVARWIGEQRREQNMLDEEEADSGQPAAVPGTPPETLTVEIRCHIKDGQLVQSLWLNGRWKVTYPVALDGNQVAQSVCLLLREEYGIEANYKLTGTDNPDLR